MLLQLSRIAQAGLRNFTRNIWLSTAATAVMTVTLVIVVISFISNLALSSTVQTTVTDKISVSVFLRNDLTDAQRDTFKTSLLKTANVASVTYITPEEAVADFKDKYKNEPKTIEALEISGNSLPSSFQIKATDTKKLSEIADVINKPENKAYLDPTTKPTYSDENKDTIDRIVRVANFFKSTGLAASILFVIISILIIFNTIRMAIFTRRDEIEIMKLVGATKWFIRGPFLFEAMLYGIIAAIIAVALSYVLLLGGGPKISNYINIASAIDLFQGYPILVVAGALLIGIIIGMISSLLAMSRYLKL